MKNTKRAITTKSNENYLFIRINKELFAEFISKAIFLIIGIITIVAFFTLAFTLGSMGEANEVSKTAIIVCISCATWLGLVTLGYKLIMK